MSNLEDCIDLIIVSRSLLWHVDQYADYTSTHDQKDTQKWNLSEQALIYVAPVFKYYVPLY